MGNECSDLLTHATNTWTYTKPPKNKFNKLQSPYLVVSTLNLQHSLNLWVIFKVAFWDDWPSFIWRRAVFCSTLSIRHHLASIIMRSGFTVPMFYFGFGVPPYQICLYLEVSLKSLSCLKLKLETFHMALHDGPKSHAVFWIHTITKFDQDSTLLAETNHDRMSTVLYR